MNYFLNFRVGLTRIPSLTKLRFTAPAILSDHYRCSVIKHLRLSDLDERLEHFVAFSHWHPKVLELFDESKDVGAKKMFPRVLSLVLGREIGLESYDRLPAATSSPTSYYVNVPSATLQFYDNYLNTEFIDRQIGFIASGDGFVSPDLRKSLSASGSEETAGSSSLARLSTVQQRSSFVAAEIQSEERNMKKQKVEDKDRARREKRLSTIELMSEDGQKLLKKSVAEVNTLKRQLEEMEKKNKALREKKKEMHCELDVIKQIMSKSIVRSNIVCPTWHKNNPRFVPYWLGFISYAEFTIYHNCFWPDVSTIVRIKDGNISEFEKSMITKMFFRKGLEFELIGYIWGRTNIGRYVRSWAPLWGEVGADLSILDINETILIALTPEDYINGCTDKICGLVDGKDFKTETIRIHSGITRASHSNKVNCSALRVLSWILNNGLNVERSEPYLGRASETHIVQVLGSHVGEVPIRECDRVLYSALKKSNHTRECRVRDTVQNTGRMIASVTRNKGECMEGDEDASAVDKEITFCNRADQWFKGAVAAHENGSVVEKRKARVFTTLDHDNLEKTVLRSGPNQSPESKLVQLRRLQRLDVEYRNGNLEGCLLSEYLEVTKKLRKDMIAVLRGRPLKGLDGEILDMTAHNARLVELRLPLRLGKFPRGWAILADRGFANDATRYPNMNVQMTPSFLSGRDQFTYSELSADMVKCKLRYISETNFARVTDENLLTDVIPASVLPYIKDCISWGHASANLCKKYKDRDYV